MSDQVVALTETGGPSLKTTGAWPGWVHIDSGDDLYTSRGPMGNGSFILYADTIYVIRQVAGAAHHDRLLRISILTKRKKATRECSEPGRFI